MADYFYNIHDIVKFKVATKDRLLFSSYFERFKHEFEYFKVDSIDKADFVVEVGPFKASNEGCVVTEEGRYYIKEGYLYTNDSYKTAQWEVEISRIEDETVRVRVNPNFSGYLFFGSYIIDFLLRVKMNQKGYPFVHGSGIVKDGTAYLFPARSGTGKTVTTMHFLDNGFQLLGDNFFIGHADKILSFPSSMNIFYYNLAPKIKKGLTSNILFGLKLKRLLYQATMGYVKIFTPVSVKSLFKGQIVDEAVPGKIYLMQVGSEFGIEEMSREDIIKSLLYNNQMDAYPFIDYISEYAYVFPDSWLSRHWEVLEENYGKLVDRVDSWHKVVLPKRVDSVTLQELGEIIES
ncbi:MAG TPA: hypothetical protein ENH82_17155 [bacterium]|nr:hypothetical protein [bacterium]